MAAVAVTIALYQIVSISAHNTTSHDGHAHYSSIPAPLKRLATNCLFRQFFADPFSNQFTLTIGAMVFSLCTGTLPLAHVSEC